MCLDLQNGIAIRPNDTAVMQNINNYLSPATCNYLFDFKIMQ